MNGRYGAAYQQNISAFHVGGDVWQSVDVAGKRQQAGLYLAPGGSQGQIREIDDSAAGSSYIHGYGLGAYFSHVLANQAWIDVTTQISHLKASTQAQDDSGLHTKGMVAASALEGSYPLFNSQGWKLAPHGRLLYQYQRINASDDGIARAEFKSSRSLRSEIGLQINKQGSIHNKKYVVGLDLMVGHKFQPNAQTRIIDRNSGFDALTETRTQGGFWSAKASGHLQINKNLSLYAQVGRSLRFDPQRSWVERVGWRAQYLVTIFLAR